MQWRASAAKVCTSEARKIRVPLARARDGVPQEGLVSLLGAERRRLLVFVFRAGVAGRNRPAEVGRGGRRAAGAGRRLPPCSSAWVEISWVRVEGRDRARCGKFSSSCSEPLEKRISRSAARSSCLAFSARIGNDSGEAGTHRLGVWKPHKARCAKRRTDDPLTFVSGSL